MLVYFSENKCQYHKGQLVPFFIAIIVVLVVAALVTVNIGKTSITKTETANACDAGALAGATAMANIFISLAEAKESMKEAWNDFHDSMINGFVGTTGLLRAIHGGTPGVSGLYEGGLRGALNQGYLAGSIIGSTLVYFGTCLIMSCSYCGKGLGALLSGAGTAAQEGGAAYTMSKAISNLKMAKELTASLYSSYQSLLVDGITPWHQGMQENYANLKDSVEQGYDSAVDISYKLAFYNSGISSKLADGGSGNNNKEVFSKWLDNEDAPYILGNYSWQDGQGRAHIVNVDVAINDIPTYTWITAGLTYSAFVNLFTRALVLCDEMKGNITDAISELFHAIYAPIIMAITGAILGSIFCTFCKEASGIWSIVTCALYYAGVALFYAGALAAQAYIAYATGVYIKNALNNHRSIRDTQQNIINGLWPSRTVRNPDNDDFLAWLEEVPHDHLVKVRSDQSHEGKSYSLWEVVYPRVKSAATARFGGATSELSTLDYNANLISVE